MIPIHEKKGLRIPPKPLNFLAGATGLEPAASGVTVAYLIINLLILFNVVFVVNCLN
jgi:hypothetical protein